VWVRGRGDKQRAPLGGDRGPEKQKTKLKKSNKAGREVPRGRDLWSLCPCQV